MKKIKILTEKISEKHNDSFWYDGAIAEITKANGTKLRLIAVGDIRIHDNEGELVYDCKERNYGIEGGLKDDDDLRKIGYDYSDKYYWENNNWFEVIFKKKNSDAWDSIIGDFVFTYDEALELLKSYINSEY